MRFLVVGEVRRAHVSGSVVSRAYHQRQYQPVNPTQSLVIFYSCTDGLHLDLVTMGLTDTQAEYLRRYQFLLQHCPDNTILHHKRKEMTFVNHFLMLTYLEHVN